MLRHLAYPGRTDKDGDRPIYYLTQNFIDGSTAVRPTAFEPWLAIAGVDGAPIRPMPNGRQSDPKQPCLAIDFAETQNVFFVSPTDGEPR